MIRFSNVTVLDLLTVLFCCCFFQSFQLKVQVSLTVMGKQSTVSGSSLVFNWLLAARVGKVERNTARSTR